MTSRLRTTMAASVAILALLAPALVAPALAEDATSAQAASLATQIRLWFAASAPAVTAGPGPIKVTPDGDHLDVGVPMQLHGSLRGDVEISGTAREHDGKWSLAAIRTMVPLKLTMDMPVPKKEGDKGPTRTAPVTYTVNTQAQDGQIDYDPSFATPSTWSNSIKGLTVLAEGATISQATTVEEGHGSSTLTPSGPDRADFATEGTVSGYTLASKAGPDLPAFSGSVATIHVTSAATGVNRDHAGRLFQTVVAIGQLMKAAPGEPPQLPRPMLANMIAEFQDFASGMNVLETFTGIKVDAGGIQVALNQMVLGVGGTSEAGMLRTSMNLGYDGLQLPDLGLGGLEVLIPRGIAINPYVSGVAVADLARIATAMNDKKDPSPADMTALFSHGGVVTGLDKLSVDVAGATFTGQGKLTMTSPSAMVGTAQLTAENYDAMVQKVGALPMAAQAMPVLIFLKGIGKTDGSKLVWDITYRDGKALVNNIDITAMAGPQKAAPAQVPTNPAPGGALKSPARPAPNRNR